MSSLPSKVRSVSLLVVAIAIGWPVGLAAAEDEDAAKDAAKETAKKAAARVELAKGAKYLDTGAYGRALAEFEAAYKIFPSPKIFFNMGLAHGRLGNRPEALRMFERFLAESTDAPAESVARARSEAELLRPQVAIVELTGAAGADVAVDDRPIGKLPLTEPVYLEPGGHRINAKLAEGAPPVAIEFTAVGGQRDKLDVGGGPVVVATPRPVLAPAPVYVPVTPLAPLATPVSDPPLYKQPWFWAVAAGVVVVAGVTLWLTLGRTTEYADPTLGRMDLPLGGSR